MSASVTDIARLRRMVDEPTTTTYSDELLGSYLEAWPLTDKNGVSFEDDNSAWVEAYDLHAAAADIWEEKAAIASSKHDFKADGADYSSNQMYVNYMQQANQHRAEQKAKVKFTPRKPSTSTYYPSYTNPIFDEDEESDWNMIEGLL